MPTYEYRCPVCNFELEVKQKVSDPDPLCRHCLSGNPHNENKMVKQISLSSFSLKGSGWYKTDYKRNK